MATGDRACPHCGNYNCRSLRFPYPECAYKAKTCGGSGDMGEMMPQRYKYWSQAEEAKLAVMLSAGKSAADIAHALVRSVQSVRDKALTLGLAFRQPATTTHSMARCGCQCAGGNECLLRGDIPHELHSCRMVGCECKSEQYYRAAKAARRARERVQA